MCQGYYDHEKGYLPLIGEERIKFSGRIVHSQNWPEDLDYQKKDVVVIGSGATAATLIPEIAKKSRNLTLLQRSPTYYFAYPNENALVKKLNTLGIKKKWIHEIARKQSLNDQEEFIELCQSQPEKARRTLVNKVRELLPVDYPVDPHFTPTYDPWMQRVAICPDGDLV